MPQMAPMNWLTLMISSITMLILFNVLNHFMYTPKIKTTLIKISKKTKLNWKW